MKITIERAALLRALGHVQSVVERRTTIPILSNVLLRPRGGQLGLSATDMDLEVVESARAEIVRDGQTTAPAHTLFDIVRKLRDGAQVELEVTGERQNMTLRSGRSTFTIPCLPAEDYPVLSGDPLKYEFHLAAKDLRGLIDRTRFAISTEETRYYLNGIYLHAARAGEHEVLRAVATDGHRLARVEVPLPTSAAGMPGVIVPRKTVQELRKLLDECDDAVRVELGENKIRFDLGDCILTSKLIDGVFPDYDRVIPQGNDKLLDVDRKNLAEGVDRVSTISSEKSRAVKLSIGHGNLVLSATSAENGAALEELEVGYTAQPLEIGFNARYLLDILQQIEGENVQFVMADSNAPTIVREAGDHSALYVLMPMRV